ncbi:TMEM14 family protein [Spirulina sp. CS-785/01]|uniref:TMEM14 family protein n=1 Tax=Spirulina sp. CS-785/01 TaxID=3021716 RepID=UPI00232D8561|nr:TMEM14 family protein [Spirulina sp. CS-785/01]MDB9314862.1 TMEM14 family protein [Spirulina sp. CS-785/01]
MTIAGIVAIAYGILSLVGGILGYVKSKSQISLISGTGSGVLLLIGAIAMLQGANWGAILATLITGVLIVTFLIRLSKTRKFMPAGLMVILGIPAFVTLLFPLINAQTS